MVTAVLARVSDGDLALQPLADVYCGQAQHRLADLWLLLSADEPDYAAVSRRWLDGGELDFLAQH